MEKSEKYLPIGSVVLLEGGVKELMITGYCMETPEEPGKVYDYSGYIYPEGMISSNLIHVFDHSQIKEVYFEGFKTENTEQFLLRLKTSDEGEEKSEVENETKNVPLMQPVEQMERL